MLHNGYIDIKFLAQKKISNDDEFEINRQILWLEDNLSQVLAEFRVLSHELSVMEKELDKFMNTYCKEVGMIYEELQKVNSIISSIGNNDFLAEEDDSGDDLEFSYISEDENQVHNKEIKHLYRRLAKMFHPDMTNNDQKYSEMFKQLSNSYNNNDLSGLIKIEQLFFVDKDNENESTVQKLERMEQQYNKLLNDIDKMKVHKNKIKNSEDYKLQQRVCWYKMCGDDLILEIKNNAIRELEMKKSVLALTKH